MRLTILLVVVFLWLGVFAQEASGLDSAMHRLAEEKDPGTAVSMMKEIVNEYRLDKYKDTETFDVLYGTVAVNFAMHRRYDQFETYIGLIRNQFNRTSFLNMAASKMLNDDIDPVYANRISKRTLSLYRALRNDTTSRPKDFSKEDWARFMRFAQYPYYDTYAQSLLALKQYKEALRYQKMAFEGKPEEGLPASVERYARLLELTGQKEEAKGLLLAIARRGKLNKRMTAQLLALYSGEKGKDATMTAYLDSLQRNIQATLVRELKPKLLNETAPAFALKEINGREVKLSDYAGKVVVLDLWATWCRPCIASFPAMQQMVEKHPEVVFLFIAVGETGPDALPRVKSFIEKRKYPFIVLMDEPFAPNSPQYKITASYKPDGIPAKYIIDKGGVLRFKASGFDTDAELINELEAMFTILQD